MWINYDRSLGQNVSDNDWLSLKKLLFALFFSLWHVAVNGGTKEWYRYAVQLNSYDTSEGRAGANPKKLKKKRNVKGRVQIK